MLMTRVMHSPPERHRWACDHRFVLPGNRRWKRVWFGHRTRYFPSLDSPIQVRMCTRCLECEVFIAEAP